MGVVLHGKLKWKGGDEEMILVGLVETSTSWAVPWVALGGRGERVCGGRRRSCGMGAVGGVSVGIGGGLVAWGPGEVLWYGGRRRSCGMGAGGGLVVWGPEEVLWHGGRRRSSAL